MNKEDRNVCQLCGKLWVECMGKCPNKCLRCDREVEAGLAYCEDHGEGCCQRCGAAAEVDCAPGCPNEVTNG